MSAKKFFSLIIALAAVMSVSSCTPAAPVAGTDDSSPLDSATNAPPAESETKPAETEPAETENPRGEIALNAEGYCAVGLVDDETVTILADTGTVRAMKYTGQPTAGLIHNYTYDEGTDTIALTISSTFPQVADKGSSGEDLTGWVMGAYPQSNSIYYGASYTFSADTPVFVRYSNVEWRLAHGAAAFVSSGVTRGYIGKTGSQLDFVMVVGQCGSLATMKGATTETTFVMDPDGLGFDHGDIMLDGSEPVSGSTERKTDENGLTIPDPDRLRSLVTYKKVGSLELKMTLLLPTKKVYDRAPVYYIVTGGGWTVCDYTGMLNGMTQSSDALRAAGYAVTSIQYRVMSDGADMYDIISDCMDGVRYLVKYADLLSLDTDRIITVGSSSGGHLALMVALGEGNRFREDSIFTEAEDFDIACCVSMCGLTTLYKVDGAFLSAVSHTGQLFDSADLDNGMRICSPIEYVSSDMIPILLLTGDSDPVVYPENSYRFKRAADDFGADVTLITSAGAGHSFEPVGGATSVSLNFSQVQTEIVRYLTELFK